MLLVLLQSNLFYFHLFYFILLKLSLLYTSFSLYLCNLVYNSHLTLHYIVKNLIYEMITFCHYIRFFY